MPTIVELAKKVEKIFSTINEDSKIPQIRKAENQLAEIWDTIKEKVEFAALAPIVTRARNELNTAIIFEGVANLEDNAKELKQLIGTISGIAHEQLEEAKGIRLKKVAGFLETASEAADAIKEAKDTIKDSDDLAEAGPKISAALKKVKALIAKLKKEKAELEK